MTLLLAVTAGFVLSNLAVFVSGMALGVALESWLRGRNHDV